ncbi:hypothetical protein [Polaribacter ponticola]|uniref:Uncharacterized protein n=1 Tax=Polaribacter ponticola TaxID=2978475 RepID=A0ABT5S6M0_9FLAO|nr:hypothetical protein [Polaribacter sp. MSW5]MDD7912953.1 hypothetical protein [Polaribacter sp. MSW5]MDD7913749.1 hypothetical protein [Polaribacter sp. MSW5]
MSNKAKIQGILMNCSQKSVIGWSVEESDFEAVAEEIIKKLGLCDVVVSDADIYLASSEDNVDLLDSRGFRQGAKWCRRQY